MSLCLMMLSSVKKGLYISRSNGLNCFASFHKEYRPDRSPGSSLLELFGNDCHVCFVKSTRAVGNQRLKISHVRVINMSVPLKNQSLPGRISELLLSYRATAIRLRRKSKLHSHQISALI